MADTLITPPVGSLATTGRITALAFTLGLVLTGFAPSVFNSSITTQITPPAGAATLTGAASTLAETHSVQTTPPAGSLTLTGALANVVGLNTTITPGVGRAILGLPVAPSPNLTPFPGTLNFDEFYAPSTAVLNVIRPPVGTLTITGNAPNPPGSSVLIPAAATLTLTPTASRLGTAIIPDQGVLKCQPWARLTWTLGTESDLAGYYIFHGVVTGVYGDLRIIGPVAVYVWDSLPYGNNYFSIRAYDTSANLSLYADEVVTFISGSGFSPTVAIATPTGVSLTIPAGSLTLTGQAPSLRQNALKAPPAGSLTLTGQTHALRPPVGSLVLTGLVPTLIQAGVINLNITTPSGTLTLTGFLGRNVVSPATGTLTLTGAAPTVVAVGSRTITPPAGSLVLASPTPFNVSWASDVNIILDAGGSPPNA